MTGPYVRSGPTYIQAEVMNLVPTSQWVTTMAVQRLAPHLAVESVRGTLNALYVKRLVDRERRANEMWWRRVAR